MRKNFLLPLLVIPFILSACSSEKGNVLGNNGRGQGAAGFDRPDFGQPKESPDLRGIVKTVNGNEVVILKIDRPELGQGSGDGSGSSTNDKLRENREKARPANMGPGGMPGMGMGGSFAGRGMGQGGEVSKENQAAMLEKIKEMSTGEETVVMPVGIQMLKTNSDQSEKNKDNIMVSATLEDVKQDKMVTIWLDKSITDKKVASFVMIMR